MSIRFIEADASALSTAGCGGIIKKAYFPQNINELTEISHFYNEDEYAILGGLSNTIVASDYDGGAIFGTMFVGAAVRDASIRLGGGESVAKLCSVAQYSSLGGAENFFGLPGTIGGAIMGNSGCFGANISDILESVTVFRMDDGEIEALHREEIAFGYRYCNLRKNKDFIIDATFALYPETRRVIAEKIGAIRAERRQKQPTGRSVGSFFKQYRGVSAGYYIEQAGLKGKKIGGVRISETHANFFINEGGTAEDYLRLAEYAEKTVFDKFGIRLEREVNVIGEKKHKTDGSR